MPGDLVDLETVHLEVSENSQTDDLSGSQQCELHLAKMWREIGGLSDRWPRKITEAAQVDAAGRHAKIL